MENTEIKTEYEKALQFAEDIAAICDAIKEYKPNKVNLKVGDRVEYYKTIKSRKDVHLLMSLIHFMSIDYVRELKLNNIVKPLEPGEITIEFILYEKQG